MSVPEYDRAEGGALLTRTTQDVTRMEQIYLKDIPNLVFAVLHGGLAMALMMYYSAVLGCIALVLGAAQAAVSIRMGMRIRERAGERQKGAGHTQGRVVEVLDGWTDIVLSHGKESFQKKFEKTSEDFAGQEYRAELAVRNAENIDSGISMLNRVLILGVGLFLLLQGILSVGAIAAVIRLQSNAAYLFQNFSAFTSGLANAMPSLEKIMELLGAAKKGDVALGQLPEPGEQQDRIRPEEELPEDPRTERGQVGAALELCHVSFGYRKDCPVLKDVNLCVEKGQFVILLGESGSGKSSLGKLLLGFYQKDAGEYRLMGEKIETVGRERAGDVIAYMDQRNTVFSMTLAENMRLVRPDAQDEVLDRAAALAGADSFLEKLEGGWDYRVNENGDNLSDGQKQRISLARLFVSGRPVWLIDEGTANLDPETERTVLGSLLRFRGERTILMITHRTTFLDQADRVYRLEDGRLREA